jgi:hypothetical protein
MANRVEKYERYRCYVHYSVVHWHDVTFELPFNLSTTDEERHLLNFLKTTPLKCAGRSFEAFEMSEPRARCDFVSVQEPLKYAEAKHVEAVKRPFIPIYTSRYQLQPLKRNGGCLVFYRRTVLRGAVSRQCEVGLVNPGYVIEAAEYNELTNRGSCNPPENYEPKLK